MKRAPPTGTCSASWPSYHTLAAGWQQCWVDISSGCIWVTVQVADKTAVRRDEVCTWRPVAYFLMFPHGQVHTEWSRLQKKKKTPASYNASMTMTQGVAAGGRCSRSPSTKKLPCNCLLKSLGLLSGVSNLTCLESPFLHSSNQFAAAWPWEPWIAARHSLFKTETLTLKDYQPCLS